MKSDSEREHAKEAAKQKVTGFGSCCSGFFLSLHLFFLCSMAGGCAQRALQRQKQSSVRKPQNGCSMRKGRRCFIVSAAS